MTFGTSYFSSIRKAIHHYRAYGMGWPIVRAKLNAGEIKIGSPPINSGDTAELRDGRWHVDYRSN